MYQTSSAARPYQKLAGKQEMMLVCTERERMGAQDH